MMLATPIHYGDAVRVVLPSAPAVDINTAIAHSRLDREHDFLTVQRLLTVATEMVEDYTGLGLIEQTWQQTFSAFPLGGIVLARRPLLEVVSVTYADAAGVEQTVPELDYHASGIGSAQLRGRVQAVSGAVWPVAGTAADAIAITYTVGFGTSHRDVPELIKHAVLMDFATLYEYRENLVDGRGATEIPLTSRGLLRNWRPLAVA